MTNTTTALFLLVYGLILLSFVPCFPDPYDHMTCLDFWGWAKRELIEEVKGEH